MRAALGRTNVTRHFPQFCIAAICCCSLSSTSCGAVIVVTNRTAAAVSFRLESATPTVLKPREIVLDGGDCVPIPLAEPAHMLFRAVGEPKVYLIAPGGLYYIGKKPDGQTDVGQIALTASEEIAHDMPGAVVIKADRPAEDLPPATVTIP